MASPTEQVAAEHQRSNIPREWLIEFDSWSNEALASLAADRRVADQHVYLDAHKQAQVHAPKTWARWELEYREAFGIEVFWAGENADQLKRRKEAN